MRTISQILSTSHIISFSPQNPLKIETLFSLHFIDKGNIVEKNPWDSANLIRNWVIKSICGKSEKSRLEEEWKRTEHSPCAATERMPTLASE